MAMSRKVARSRSARADGQRLLPMIAREWLRPQAEDEAACSSCSRGQVWLRLLRSGRSAAVVVTQVQRVSGCCETAWKWRLEAAQTARVSAAWRKAGGVAALWVAVVSAGAQWAQEEEALMAAGEAE